MTDRPSIRRVRLQKGRHLVKRGEVWYLETCEAGRQGRTSLGTGDLHEATRRAAEGGKQQAPAPTRSKAPVLLTLGKALEEYEEWYEKNRQASGAHRALPIVRLFIESVGEETDTRAVTREHVQRFVDGRTDGRAGITVRGDFAVIRAFIYWLARRKNAADVNVCHGIDKPKDDGMTKEAPSPDKVRAVLRALRPHPWLGDYCTVLAETGMRPSELLGLRGADVRDQLCSILPWEGRELKSKWSKRVIELNETAAAILKARKDRMFEKTRPIFPNKTGDVYAEHSVLHFFKDTLAGKRLGKVPEALRMTLYDFRHFFCSEHAAPGPQHMEIEALAAYIGHSPASTQTLLRWYADQRALRRGAPPPLVGEPKEGKVIPIEKMKGQGRPKEAERGAEKLHVPLPSPPKPHQALRGSSVARSPQRG
jgi:integrase